MVPTLSEISMQIAVMHELHPKDTVSELAAKLMLSPIFIINALDEGEGMQLFKRQRDKKGVVTEVLDTITPVDWSSLSPLAFGHDYSRMMDEIYIAVENSNREEQDIELGNLMAWTRGINPSSVEVALEYMVHKGELASYELSDPSDEKSVYTFYTLCANEGNKWGTKQFKKAKKAKK